MGFADYAPDGAIVFVQDGDLVRKDGEAAKTLVREVAPDFGLAPDGRLIAIVRLGERGGANAIDLLPAGGGEPHRLVQPVGINGTPIFTPDGKALVFTSTRSGIASFFRIDLDGTGLRQLTNAGLSSENGGVRAPGFVPPAENRHELQFVGPRTLEYRGAGGLWRLDIVTGEAHRAEEGGR